MSAVASAIAGSAAAPRQAWILSPAQDALFVVAAPLLALAAAIAAFAFLGASDATAYILLLHVVFTVAPLTSFAASSGRSCSHRCSRSASPPQRSRI
jgi:hypothetical protein